MTLFLSSGGPHMSAHSGMEEVRSCGGEALSGDKGRGALGSDSEQMEQGNTVGPGDCDGARTMTI